MLRLYIKPARSNQQQFCYKLNSDRESVQMTTNFKTCILISLCVHCLLAQMTFHVSFLGQTLANHSYVNLSLVGSGSDSVQCITDLHICCSNTDGPLRGDWYSPDGMRLPFSGDIYESRGHKTVHLHRRNHYNVSGIYRCNIPTIVVHNVADTSLREMVYVGLYHSGGEQ